MRPAVAPVSDQRQQIMDFMSGFTLETTPGAAAKVPDFRHVVRPGTTIYVTFLPGSDFDETLAVVKRLRGEGCHPVPHLAARSIPNRKFLEENLSRLVAEAGVDQVLLIGGAVEDPVGDFSDSMQVLETGLFDRYGIRKIGVAGHPEGSPDIPEQAVKQALQWKNAFARRTGAELYVVTQFCFEAQPIIEWDRRIQAEGNTLPIHIGIPGLATVKTLLAHARACGIGPSMKFVSRYALDVARLMTVSAPDRLVTGLAAYQASDPRCGIRGVHMYPLGGLRKSAEWSYAVADGSFSMASGGKGFSVNL